jgi:hypothetical protein
MKTPCPIVSDYGKTTNYKLKTNDSILIITDLMLVKYAPTRKDMKFEVN